MHLNQHHIEHAVAGVILPGGLNEDSTLRSANGLAISRTTRGAVRQWRVIVTLNSSQVYPCYQRWREVSIGRMKPWT